MRLGSFTNLRLAEIGTGVPHEMKLFWPPSPMAVYISPIASITPQICSEQATRQPTTTTISERPKMRTFLGGASGHCPGRGDIVSSLDATHPLLGSYEHWTPKADRMSPRRSFGRDGGGSVRMHPFLGVCTSCSGGDNRCSIPIHLDCRRRSHPFFNRVPPRPRRTGSAGTDY